MTKPSLLRLTESRLSPWKSGHITITAAHLWLLIWLWSKLDFRLPSPINFSPFSDWLLRELVLSWHLKWPQLTNHAHVLVHSPTLKYSAAKSPWFLCSSESFAFSWGHFVPTHTVVPLLHPSHGLTWILISEHTWVVLCTRKSYNIIVVQLCNPCLTLSLNKYDFYINIHVCMYVCLCICTHTHMCVCVCVCKIKQEIGCHCHYLRVFWRPEILI